MLLSTGSISNSISTAAKALNIPILVGNQTVSSPYSFYQPLNYFVSVLVLVAAGVAILFGATHLLGKSIKTWLTSTKFVTRIKELFWYIAVFGPTFGFLLAFILLLTIPLSPVEAVIFCLFEGYLSFTSVPPGQVTKQYLSNFLIIYLYICISNNYYYYLNEDNGSPLQWDFVPVVEQSCIVLTAVVNLHFCGYLCGIFVFGASTSSRVGNARFSGFEATAKV